MNFDFTEMKNELVGSVCRKIDELKLKKKLKKCEEKARSIKDELSEKVNKMKRKKAPAVKKTNPLTAVFLILSAMVTLFFALVAIFYGFYSFVHKKRTSGYIRVPGFKNR